MMLILAHRREKLTSWLLYSNLKPAMNITKQGSTPINVECYSGGRADETPRRIIVGDQIHVITRLIEEWLDETSATKEQTHRYRVLTEAGVTLEITRSSDGQWFLI